MRRVITSVTACAPWSGYSHGYGSPMNVERVENRHVERQSLSDRQVLTWIRQFCWMIQTFCGLAEVLKVKASVASGSEYPCGGGFHGWLSLHWGSGWCWTIPLLTSTSPILPSSHAGQWNVDVSVSPLPGRTHCLKVVKFAWTSIYIRFIIMGWSWERVVVENHLNHSGRISHHSHSCQCFWLKYLSLYENWSVYLPKISFPYLICHYGKGIEVLNLHACQIGLRANAEQRRHVLFAYTTPKTIASSEQQKRLWRKVITQHDQCWTSFELFSIHCQRPTKTKMWRRWNHFNSSTNNLWKYLGLARENYVRGGRGAGVFITHSSTFTAEIWVPPTIKWRCIPFPSMSPHHSWRSWDRIAL